MPRGLPVVIAALCAGALSAQGAVPFPVLAEIPIASPRIHHAAISSDGQLAVILDAEGIASVCDLPRGSIVNEVWIGELGAEERLSIPRSGDPIVVLDAHGPHRRYSLWTGDRTDLVDAPGSAIDEPAVDDDRRERALAALRMAGLDTADCAEAHIDPAGRSVIGVFADGAALAICGARRVSFSPRAAMCRRLALSADGAHLVLGRADRITFVEIRSGTRRTIRMPRDSLLALASGPTGPEVVAVHRDRLELWNASIARLIRTSPIVPLTAERLRSVQFTSDQRIAVIETETTPFGLDLGDGHVLHRGFAGAHLGVHVWTMDSSGDSTIGVIPYRAGTQPTTLEIGGPGSTARELRTPTTVTSVSIAPSGNRAVIVGHSPNVVFAIDMKKGLTIGRMELPVTAAVALSDRTALLFGATRVQCADLPSFEPVCELPLRDADVTARVVTPDRRRLAIARTGLVTIHDLDALQGR